jgi:nicotinate-nucleotide adenylyltransferase
MAKERIGIMGGSFDPIHQGHIRMAQCALESLRLDKVLMLPSGNPPHKPDVTPGVDRYRMVCAACATLPGLEPCREEIDRTGVIYTVDTLSILHEKYPKAELFYIIGADTLMELHKWRMFEKVLTLCTFLVCPRSWNYTPKQLDEERKRLTALGGQFILLDMEVVDVSSTEVRNAIRDGVAKLNIHTDLCLAGMSAMRAQCAKLDPAKPVTGDYLETRTAKVAAIKACVLNKLQLFGSVGKA